MSENSFFRPDSPYLGHPLLTAERSASEVDFLESVWPIKPGARILDVGCGFGRHSVELARRGYAVVGIDPAAAMIEAARRRAAEAAVAVDFRQVHGETFSDPHLFDGAICLFTSLGQVEGGVDNLGLLPKVHRALKNGANFIVEVPQREAAVQQLRPYDRFGSGEAFTEISRSHDDQRHVINEYFRVVNNNNEMKFHLSYRLFTLEELRELLGKAGFIVEHEWGDYVGTKLSTDQPMMLLMARKDD